MAKKLTEAELKKLGYGPKYIADYLKGNDPIGKNPQNDPLQNGGTTTTKPPTYVYDWTKSPILTGNYPKPGETSPSITFPGSGSGGSGGGGGSTPAPTTPTAPAVPGVPGAVKESAYQAFRNFMLSLGIPMGADIEGIIRKAVEDGYGPQDMYLVLPDIQNTGTWRNRFPGWHARVSAGYNQLTVGEYLALENSYHRVLQEAGLPKGFYDDPSDFGQWISNNVSVQEIQDRVNIAMDMVRQVDPAARDLLTKFYGVTSGDLASYFLDQGRALPALERQYKSVNVAQWAVRNGLKVMGPSHYENLVEAGITEEMAMQGYATVRSFSQTLGQLGDIYGDRYSQLDAENDVFFGQDDRRRRIIAKETGTWSGSSRGNPGSADRGTSY